MGLRRGNNPKRRIAPAEKLSENKKSELIERVKYVGSGHHKRNPADFGLERTSPRPTKSLCDTVKVVVLARAQELIAAGINAGMVSEFMACGFPKYIWCVDTDGEVYEAKTD